MTKRKPPEQHRIHVVMKAPRKAAELVIYARLVHDKMAENVATFPAPEPPLTKLQDVIDALKQAAADAESSGIGGANRRESAATAVRIVLEDERAYVEKVAVADPKNAAVIAERAAMHLLGRSLIYKPTLALEPGPHTGSVHAVAKAVPKAMTYFWQISADGVTWVDWRSTTRADTMIDGREPGSTLHVRFRVMLRGSQMTDWSVSVSRMVV